MPTNFKLRGYWPLVLAATAFCAYGSLPVEAQAPSPASDEAPVPHLATAAPASSQWTIKFQYKQDDPYPKTTNPVDAKVYAMMRVAHPRIVSTLVIKAGAKRKEVDDYPDGSQTIRWVVGNHLLTDSRVSHSIQIQDPKQAGVAFEKDFHELDWVNTARYKGHRQFHSVDCCVYESSPGPDGAIKTAYINAQSGLPEAIDLPDAVLIFSSKASTDSLEMPADLKRRLSMVTQMKPG